ncbi:MAG: NAD(P)H-binding protein [Chloroflexota bacterium]
MILVTGATGYVGGRVLARLAEQGTPARGLVRRADTRLPAGVEPVRGDVAELAALAAALEGVDTVIHAAAITGDRKEPYRGAYDRVNREGTENLLAAAGRAGVERLVAVSGLGCRPAPAGTYMATRWGLEEAVRAAGIPYVILQPSVLFGNTAPFVSALAGLVRRSPVLPALGGGGTRFQPLWIEDLVTCLLAATRQADLLGQSHPLGGAEILTFREILQVIRRALGKRRLVVPLPLAIARLQARVMVAVLSNPPLTPAAIELFGFDNATDLDSVERRFGFRPKGFREDPGV